MYFLLYFNEKPVASPRTPDYLQQIVTRYGFQKGGEIKVNTAIE
jgi:hypothetical protein